MIKKSAICFAVAGVATLGLVGCNSSSDSDEDTLSSSVLINSFSLTADDDVLDDLDSVYFSIDLVKAAIFNADSLPYGTDVSALIPVITSSDGLSVAELHVPRPGQADTIYNYITNSTDSIDFSNGPVILHVVSLNGEVSRDYTVKVNVHTQKTDSLAWGDVARRELPSKFAAPKAQRTTAQGDVLYCLTSDGSQYSVAMISNPGSEDWAIANVTLPEDADINTFNGTDDALYILTTSGELYKSTDGAFSWTDCGVKMDNIYGGYGKELIGSVEKSDGWHRVSYPSGIDEAITDANFPVSGASVPVIFSTELALSNQMLIFGGRTATGDLTSATWGFDGTNWASFSLTPLPKCLENPIVVPYFTYKTADASWAKGDYATLIAFGGRESDGTINRVVYNSCDYGITWSKADSLMQLPDCLPEMADVQGYVFKSVLTTRSNGTWRSFPTRRIPSWLMPMSDDKTRVTKPITEWECPYIYLFGGVDANGTLYNTIWRGVINRYTFKPLV